VKGSALVAFFPSGILGIFVLIERVLIGFAFDEPSRGFLFDLIRWSVVISIFGYPAFWLTALTLTIIGTLKDWPAKYLILFAIFPYFVAGYPFLLMLVASPP